MREFAHGFSSEDGYDVRKIRHWPKGRIEAVNRAAALLREELASEHTLFTARTRDRQKAAQRYTRQSVLPKRKKYVVHVERPSDTRIRVKAGTLEVATKVEGGYKIDQFFELPRKAKSFKDIAKMLKGKRGLLAKMPPGYYVIATSTHGNIAAPIPKERILSMLQQRYFGYDVYTAGRSVRDDRGLAEVVNGFRFTGAEFDDARRELYARRKARVEAARQRSRDKYQQNRFVRPYYGRRLFTKK